MANRGANGSSNHAISDQDQCEPDQAVHTTASSCHSLKAPLSHDGSRWYVDYSRSRHAGVKRKRGSAQAVRTGSERVAGSDAEPAPQSPSRSAGAVDPAAPGSPTLLGAHHLHDSASLTSLIRTPITFNKPGHGNGLLPTHFGPSASPYNSEQVSITEPKEESAAYYRLLESMESSPSVTPCNTTQTGNSAVTSRWQTPNSWFQFPPEIRNMIYHEILQLPDSKTLYRGLRSRLDHPCNIPDNNNPPDSSNKPSRPVAIPKIAFRTPTILLLSRAITAECLPILQNRTLVISHLPPWLASHSRPLPLTRFIGRRTLQSIRKFDLRLSFGAGRGLCPLRSGWAWLRVVEDLLDVLMEANKLEEFRVLMRLCDTSGGLGLDRLVWKGERRVFHRLVCKIIRLRQNQPNAFNPGKVVMDFWQVDDDIARKLWFDEKAMTLGTYEPCEEVRAYPDPEMWPGCIMEFC